jgi:hypothetical protein
LEGWNGERPFGVNESGQSPERVMNPSASNILGRWGLKIVRVSQRGEKRAWVTTRASTRKEKGISARGCRPPAGTLNFLWSCERNESEILTSVIWTVDGSQKRDRAYRLEFNAILRQSSQIHFWYRIVPLQYETDQKTNRTLFAGSMLSFREQE